MIYVIRAIGSQYVKIGRAADPIRRMRELQVSMPMKLVLASVADWPNYYERRIHNSLRKHHVRGEWFMMCEEIFILINKMQDGAMTLDDWHEAYDPPKRLARVLAFSK